MEDYDDYDEYDEEPQDQEDDVYDEIEDDEQNDGIEGGFADEALSIAAGGHDELGDLNVPVGAADGDEDDEDAGDDDVSVTTLKIHEKYSILNKYLVLS